MRILAFVLAVTAPFLAVGLLVRLDAGGATVRSRQLPTGVVIDLATSTIPVDPDDTSRLKARFDSRGRCPDNGTLVLEDSTGEQRKVSINPLGQMRRE